MTDIGGVVQIAAEIRDADGVLTNPTTATLTINLPDGTTATPTVTLPPAETGILRVDYVTTQAGLHHWRLATSTPTTVVSDAFNVAPADGSSLVGLAETKAHLNIPASDTSEDEELRGFIASASRVVEDIVGDIARKTVTETNSGGERHVVLTHSPVISVTSVKVDGETVDSGDWTFSPSGLLARRWGRWPTGLHNIETAYVAGRQVAQPNIIDATKELIRINWRPQQGGNYSPFDGGGSDDFGVSRAAEASLQGEIRLGFFIPNTVTQRLQPDRRGPVVL